jgi:hypothetical protein
MMDDDSLKQLLRSNDELLQLCKWLNERRDMETSSRLISHFRSLGLMQFVRWENGDPSDLQCKNF